MKRDVKSTVLFVLAVTELLLVVFLKNGPPFQQRTPDFAGAFLSPFFLVATRFFLNS